jgi:acyl CoA:acetate/3-ketoacid CoA transferase alpha subunit
MATAADVTIAEAQEIVPAGTLDPEVVVTPGVYVNRIVQAERDEVRWFDS